MNALEIKNVSKRYAGFALDTLDLTLPCGCIMGLIGENGAGKTTTIKLILDMIRRDGGSISVLGRDNKEGFSLTKEEIGVVFDEAGFSNCLTPRHVGKIMRNIYRAWDDDAYADYLKKLDLPENKRFKDFSRGMKMKLSIAVALSHHARLLILDEPTSGLDPVVRDEVTDIFSDFTRDERNAVLISSHIVSDLEKICDYIAFLHKGKLMLCEEKDVLRERYGIIRCTAAELAGIDPGAVVGKRVSPYGVEAIVARDKAPRGAELSPVDIEQLFIFMAKEAV